MTDCWLKWTSIKNLQKCNLYNLHVILIVLPSTDCCTFSSDLMLFYVKQRKIIDGGFTAKYTGHVRACVRYTWKKFGPLHPKFCLWIVLIVGYPTNIMKLPTFQHFRLYGAEVDASFFVLNRYCFYFGSLLELL